MLDQGLPSPGGPILANDICRDLMSKEDYILSYWGGKDFRCMDSGQDTVQP